MWKWKYIQLVSGIEPESLRNKTEYNLAIYDVLEKVESGNISQIIRLLNL